MKLLLILIIVCVVIFWLYRMIAAQHISKFKPATFKPFKDAVQPKLDQIKVEPMAYNDEEQVLFDDVAKLFFEQQRHVVCLEQAENIQQQYLNKMPAKTNSQIGEFDLGEWCIYWNYRQQSLEYYVGKYGIFYTHVDRFGIEHRNEMKI
ncbi:hypothetical protein [Acinetobacter sp. Marseille-Q1623]|uniref:hypothetical protein n=1 Tax=Acinetobacter sp. Marseille-Q1623 TaxID=2697501 RepID=UPI00157AE3F1|nr:hypothetical protein [Acinetobacter sp. Marseille-Q1623]